MPHPRYLESRWATSTLAYNARSMSQRASTLLPDAATPPAGGPARGTRSALPLALCTLLHGFTHAYGTILVPLYLLMVADLRLAGVNAASLVVTVYGLV